MNNINSEKIESVSKALMQAKKQIPPIFKDSTNPYFKSKYASLGAFIDATDTALSDSGLLLFQCVGDEAGKPVLYTTITHVDSGQWIRSSAPLLNKSGDSQGLGSAITYMRRYSLCAMLNICAEVDDDGHKATEIPKEKPKTKIVETEIQKENMMADFIRESRLDDSLHYNVRGFLIAHCKKFEISMSETIIKYKDVKKLLDHAHKWSEVQKNRAVA